MKYKYLIISILITSTISCMDNDHMDDVKFDSTPYVIQTGSFPLPPIANDNKLTVQIVKLGRMLFYEKMLSGNGTQACASCHIQKFAFSDTSRFSIGIKGLPGKRQAMGVFNMAWHTNEFFWDGRAHLLRDQSLKPIQDELEMDETLDNVIAKLKGHKMYRNQFIRAFGTDEINSTRISLALEQFMNSIVSNNSKYDDYLKDSTVFNESEKRGLKLFITEYNPFFPDKSGADCQHCHGGFNFENNEYMNNGLDEESNLADFGREKVTGNPKDRGKFKVTSLRNVAITPPYMHDGRFKTLEEVIEHYNSGIKASATLDPALEQNRASGLQLTSQQKMDLIAFLKTLTDKSLQTNPEYMSPF